MSIRAYSYCCLEDLEDSVKQKVFALDYYLQHMDMKELVQWRTTKMVKGWST